MGRKRVITPSILFFLGFLFSYFVSDQSVAADFRAGLKSFFVQHCNDCHADGASEGGLDLEKLSGDLADPAAMAKWVRIYDRVQNGEMPPKDSDRPNAAEIKKFATSLSAPLTVAHAKLEGTVLRRLNRKEYNNTMNDLFGTMLDLEDMLPEDGRSHEFDNVGESLGLSLVHLQKYMEAAEKVIETSIVKTIAAPEVVKREARYTDDKGSEKFIGDAWKKLPDGAIVRFAGYGYPSGMVRGTGVREAGYYRIRVTGYAHQSKQPISFSVGGTTFAQGAEKPIYGFYSLPPDKPSSIELTTWVEKNYMVAIEPYGISDPDRYRRKKEGIDINSYKGPGLAILKVDVEGPLVADFPSKGHRLIFDGVHREEIKPRNPKDRLKSWYKPQFEIKTDDEHKTAYQSLHRVITAAYRRPVSEEDVIPFVTLFADERKEGASFEEALKTAVIGVFCSPQFLYLQENQGKLDDYAIASRLSYFLTRTAPDKELLLAAESGQLTSDPKVLKAHTERLIKSEHFQRFVTDFSESWLDLRNMDFTAPDKSLFPEFDAYLRFSMPLETEAYLRELIESNLPITHLVQSDFAMLNSRMAELYDLPPITGSEFRKVKLPSDSVRGGFLSQASVLKVTANGTNSSPVTRGAWVMERIFGETPPPPPPGVPGVEPDIRGATTLRDLLAKHRTLPACNACHQKIDPPGFALECFNPIGGLRTRYRSLGEGEKINLIVDGRNVRYRLGLDVDSSGELPDGTKFADFKAFQTALAKDKKMLAKTFTKKLLTFATGRELGFSDRVIVEEIVNESAKNGYRIKDLIHLAIASKIFNHK